MLPYYSIPFVSYNVPGMYNPQIQQQFVPQYTQTASVYPAASPQIYAQNFSQDLYDSYGLYDMEMLPSDRPNDPQPVLSNNPTANTINLFKELTGYPNYGNPSGNADILYTGNRGAWTFQLPLALTAIGDNLRGQILIRAVLDDHYDVPANRYSANISVNDRTVHSGRLNLEHGRPEGGRFNNWRTLTFNVNNLRRNNRVVIVNTSSTGRDNWIAFDWMELRLSPGR